MGGHGHGRDGGPPVIKVFLSSTAKDLAAYRDAVDRVIRDLRDFHCFPMENFGAQDAPPSDFCRDEVARCDVFVAIIGHCYGSRPARDGASFTHAEYVSAVAAGKPRLVFLAPEDFPTPANLIRAMSPADHEAQRAFRELAMAERVAGTFGDPPGLAKSVVTALSNWRMAKLEKDLGVSQAHVLRFLADIEGREVPAHEVDAKLEEAAARFKELMERPAEASAADPRVAGLRRQSRSALEAGAFETAEKLLDEAKFLDLAAIERLEGELDARRRSAAEAAFDAGELLMTRLRYPQGLARLAEAVELTPAGHDDLRAVRLHHHGVAAWRVGDFPTAVSALRQALAIRERTSAPDDPALANALGALAVALRSARQVDEAEALYRRQLALRDRPGRPVDRDLGTTLSNFGTLLHNAGRYEEAEPLFRRAVEIGERLLDPEDRDLGHWLNNLGGVVYSRGGAEEAEPFLRRALAIGEKTLDPGHPDLATRLANLAYLLAHTDRAAEAEPLCRRALAIREGVLLPGHPDIATSRGTMAIVLEALGRFEEAETFRSPSSPSSGSD
jgi:tetratricopeptide (TPR) repeat protein